jgi:hypothetical protein
MGIPLSVQNSSAIVFIRLNVNQFPDINVCPHEMTREKIGGY